MKQIGSGSSYIPAFGSRFDDSDTFKRQNYRQLEELRNEQDELDSLQ